MAPIDVARRYADAWLAGDLEAILDAYADDVVLHWPGDNPFAGTHAGKPAALDAIARMAAVTGRQLVRVEAVLGDDGDRAALVVVERWGAHELRRVLVYRVAGDRFVECRVLDEDQALADRLLGAGQA